ncbi:hypothetical protein PORY_001335 [Pneumocystis oryctolagi]|uniref:Uncharacterized protein n=1 Tax=Pneumocystis oryctolagi TaxID=42067 RepID=A0ACB7CCE6_9ASCO|nr:hypothetical protein PORY_001335 [Pneumocystis oryctolagi]
MTDDSNFSSEISDNNVDNDFINVNEIKKTESCENLQECEDLIRIIKEKQEKISVMLNKIDDIKKEYEKLYNEKQAIQKYIGNLVEIHNKSSKK